MTKKEEDIMKIAINGFGRIGRLVFRLMEEDNYFDIVAINDLSTPEELAYLLKYDTNHRNYNKEITYDEENIIRDAFMDSIGKATTSIKIASPYFVPDEEALSAIRRAARSGIQVQVMMPGKGDRAISYYGNTSFINRLLSAGVEVYFYDKEAFLHCKYMIIDDQVATIGSTNFDVRSFYLNHEISAFIYGPSQAVAEIVQQFTTDLARCEQVTLSQRARRPISQRVKEKLSEFFAPLL